MAVRRNKTKATPALTLKRVADALGDWAKAECPCCADDMTNLTDDDNGIWVHEFEDGIWMPCDATDIHNVRSIIPLKSGRKK